MRYCCGISVHTTGISNAAVGSILINEGMALLATLVYGIFIHFVIAIINRLRK